MGPELGGSRSHRIGHCGRYLSVAGALLAPRVSGADQGRWAFNDKGMASLDPQWMGGRPRLITSGDEHFIVTTATTRFEALGQPFTRWSLRKLPAHIADNEAATVKIGREWPSPDSSR